MSWTRDTDTDTWTSDAGTIRADRERKVYTTAHGEFARLQDAKLTCELMVTGPDSDERPTLTLEVTRTFAESVLPDYEPVSETKRKVRYELPPADLDTIATNVETGLVEQADELTAAQVRSLQAGLASIREVLPKPVTPEPKPTTPGWTKVHRDLYEHDSGASIVVDRDIKRYLLQDPSGELVDEFTYLRDAKAGI